MQCCNQVILLRPKKSNLVFGNWLGEIFFYHSPARIVKCVPEHKFSVSKKQKQNKKQTNKKTKKAKETKEER